MSILSFGKESIVYGFGGILLRAISLIVLPIFTVYLGPSEYGILALLTTMSAVIQILIGLGSGVSMGLLYYQADCNQSKASVVWATLVLHLISIAVIFLTITVSKTWFVKLIHIDYSHLDLVLLALANTGLSVISGDLLLWLQFERRAVNFIVITILGTTIGTLISLSNLMWFEIGVEGVIWGQVATNLIIILSTIGSLIKFGKYKISLVLFVGLIKNGIPMIPSFIFLFMLSQGNRYILEENNGLSSVGIYSIGFNLGSIISIVTSSITTAWFPFFMNYLNKPKEGEIIFGRVTTFYIAGLGFCCLIIGVFADPFVKLILHSQYHKASSIAVIIATSLSIQGLFNLLLPGLYFKKEVKFIAIIQGIAALISLPVNYYLILSFNMEGAAFGVLFSNIFLVVITFIWNQYRSLDYPCIRYEWYKIIKIITVIIIMYLIYIAVEKILNFNSLILSLGLVFFALLLLIFQFELNERKVLKNMLLNIK